MELIQWDEIRNQIETAQDIEVLTDMKDKLRAYQILAEQSKQSAEVQSKIAIYKARADRKCGEWLDKNIKRGNTATLKQNTESRDSRHSVTLKDIGITRDESSRLQKIASIPEDEFEKILNTAEEEVSKVTNNMLVTIAKKADRLNRRPQFEAPDAPNGKYDVIYADPPWRYDFAESSNRAIENQYPTMDIEDICNLSIPAADNSVLFMWATAPKLKEALLVIEAWGFEYKTHAIWDKEKIGMGYWFRGQHELLMVATKGKVQPPSESFRASSVIRSPRTKHSVKPDEATEIIDKYYPEARKIELFSRNKRAGWDVWGNQV